MTAEPREETPVEPAAAPPKPKEKPRRRRRWVLRILVALFIVGVALRVALWLALPTLVDRAARRYGLQLKYEDLSLTFLTGNMDLWHLVLTPEGGGEPIFDAEYLNADLDVTALFRGDLVVKRLEADGLDIFLDRAPDRSFPQFQKMLQALRASAPPEEKPPIEVSSVRDERDIDLRSPLQLDALRLQHCEIHLRDASFTPPIATRWDINVRVSDVGSTKRDTRFQVTLASPRVVGTVSIEGKGRSNDEGLQVEFAVLGRGLELIDRSRYLEALGLPPVASHLGIRLEGNVQLTPLPAVPAEDAAGAGGGNAAPVKPVEPEKQPRAFAGKLALRNMAIEVDREPQIALERLEVAIERLAPTELRVGGVTVEGGRLVVGRLPTGSPVIAGLEIRGSRAGSRPEEAVGTPPAAVPAVAAVPATAPPAVRPGPAPAGAAQPRGFAWSVGQVEFRRLEAHFRDAVIGKEHDQPLRLEEATIGAIRSDAASASVKFLAAFAVPGVVETVRIEGEATPLAARKTIALQVSAADLTARSIAPYLAAAGLESTLEKGAFACKIEGEFAGGGNAPISASFALRDVSLKDGAELVGFEGLRVSGVEIDPGFRRIIIDRVEAGGPGFTVEREASGAVRAAGFRWRPPATKPGGGSPPEGAAARESEVGLTRRTAAEDASAPVPAARASPTGSAQPAIARLPAIELRHFAWKGSPIRFRDASFSPGASIELSDMGIEVDNLVLDPDPAAAASTAALRAWLRAPGLVEEVQAKGTLVTSAGKLDLATEVMGRGVTAKSLAPYLERLGARPTLPDGEARARLAARVDLSEGGPAASFSIEDVSLAAGGEEVIGLGALRVADVRPGESALRIGSVEIDAPRGLARRAADGTLRLAGVEILPPRAEEPASVAGAGDAPPPARERASPAPAAPGSAPGVVPPPTPPSVVELAKLSLREAKLRWVDDAVAPPVDVAAVASATLEGLVLGREAEPARFHCDVLLAGTPTAAAIRGTLATSPSVQGASAAVTVSGLKTGPFGPYIPPGMRVALEDGRLASHLEARIERHPEGGRRALLHVDDTIYRDGETGEPLFAAERVRVLAPRIDPAGGLIDVEEISVRGVSGRCERASTGELLLFGVGIATAAAEAAGVASVEEPAATKESAAPREPAAVKEPAPKEPPGTKEPAAVSREAPAGAGSRQPAPAQPPDAAPAPPPAPARPRVYPVVRLGRIDLHLARFTVTDRARSAALPLEIEDFRLESVKECKFLGERPEENEPADFRFTGRIDPLVESIAVTASLSPFAATPLIKAAAEVRGVRGKGVTDLVPELAELVDGSALTDGRIRGKLELSLEMKKRHALDFTAKDPFGFHLVAEDIRYQDGEKGRVFLGLDRFETEVARIDPVKGDVHVKRIELTTPRAHFSREANGIHALGLVLADPLRARAPGGATPEPVAAEDGAGAAKDAAQAAEATPPAARPPGAERRPEIRIDQIIVGGMDVTIADETVNPPLRIPLTDLDLEIRGVTTRALEEPRAIRVRAVAGAGKIQVPARDSAGELVERSAFEEVAASGRFALYPSLKGWLKLNIGALDLGNFKGSAEERGFELHHGVFDSSIDVRFRGDGTVAVSNRLVFTDLDLEEPADGPLRAFLQLPAPLDTVLFVLRDEDGSIEIPLSFEAGKEGIGTGQILKAGLVALSSMIANAIAASPLRIAGTIGGLVTGEEEEVVREPIVLSFEPGETLPAESVLAGLAAIIEEMRDDETVAIALNHELGKGDVAIARGRANPSPALCREVLTELGSRRLDLVHRREGLVAETRAAYATGRTREARANTDKLGALDVELGEMERSMDKVLAFLRSGAERENDRRTRAACAALGRARLESVSAWLLERGVPDMAARLTVTRARFSDPGERELGGIVVTARNRKLP